MTEFETIAICILVIVYSCVFYMAGRANLLNLVMTMIQNAIKELEEKLKDNDEGVK